MTSPYGTDRLPPVIRERCGSNAGYTQHIAHGEYACTPCREAHNKLSRDSRRGDTSPRGVLITSRRIGEHVKELRGLLSPEEVAKLDAARDVLRRLAERSIKRSET